VLHVPVRAAGVALLFWLVPVAYVDRTDAYQIRGRGGRVALAVAGPLLDGAVMGVTAVAAVVWPTAATAHLLVFQVFTLILNVNPLLPSDGYVAIEAATGLVDPRGRAYALLRCRLRRRPLPAHVAAMSPAARRAHLVYGVLCALYVLVIGWAVASGVLALVRHVGNSLQA
jgi:putative peptide zinc metalloprotease protein